MSGLPRAKDNTRPRDVFKVMILGGVEKLTESLRRGDPYDHQSLVEMQHLQQRLEAFSDALDARVGVLEDDQ